MFLFDVQFHSDLRTLDHSYLLVLGLISDVHRVVWQT